MWVTRTVEAPAGQAWEVLVDIRRWPEWGPTLRSATLDHGGHRLGPGATGRLRPVLGPSLGFCIDHYDDDPADGVRSWSWRVADVPATGHRVDDLGDGHCRVGLSVPLLAVPYALACAEALRRIDGILTR
jgi:hypothetical protein